MSQQSAIGTPLQAKPDTTAGNSTTAGAQAGVTPLIDPVSYTHLTLPTIYSV